MGVMKVETQRNFAKGSCGVNGQVLPVFGRWASDGGV
jgi:hypothetical protein